MKYVLLIAIALGTLTANAQRDQARERGPRHEMRGERPDFSPEQIAELRTKRLTLDLDLNVSQQNKIKALQLELAKEGKVKRENRKERKDLSADDLYELQNNRLENQIAHKKEMKAILNSEQFAKWEKGKQRMARGHRMHRMKRHS